MLEELLKVLSSAVNAHDDDPIEKLKAQDAFLDALKVLAGTAPTALAPVVPPQYLPIVTVACRGLVGILTFVDARVEAKLVDAMQVATIEVDDGQQIDGRDLVGEVR